MKCPRCGSNMIEKKPSVIYLTNPPQRDSVLWCACGHSEDRGRVYERSSESRLLDDWKIANGKVVA